ncbi:LOW QUALITY PROTEIN: hypothetical protein CVT26_008636 [Gymnopilus dilepis]|uniref:Uncharacterized protein n=1 Tax=Gymnopilus dilepis TaxID=231916 RepID=A0A409XXW3_9AGAR|nr:LOW QUALITY PROTEIN: hypothetical protein CVT26_008636 [Gymnopilus dilepis]
MFDATVESAQLSNYPSLASGKSASSPRRPTSRWWFRLKPSTPLLKPSSGIVDVMLLPSLNPIPDSLFFFNILPEPTRHGFHVVEVYALEYLSSCHYDVGAEERRFHLLACQGRIGHPSALQWRDSLGTRLTRLRRLKAKVCPFCSRFPAGRTCRSRHLKIGRQRDISLPQGPPPHAATAATAKPVRPLTLLTLQHCITSSLPLRSGKRRGSLWASSPTLTKPTYELMEDMFLVSHDTLCAENFLMADQLVFSRTVPRISSIFTKAEAKSDACWRRQMMCNAMMTGVLSSDSRPTSTTITLG